MDVITYPCWDIDSHVIEYAEWKGPYLRNTLITIIISMLMDRKSIFFCSFSLSKYNTAKVN